MIPTHYRERARTISQHEMGHYVIAKAMGFSTGEVTLRLESHEKHDGGSRIYLEEPFEGVGQIQRYLERRVLVLFAGAIAETLPPQHGQKRGVDQDKAGEIILSLSAASDYGKAREAISMLRNILHPQTLASGEASDQKIEITNRLWDRAVQLVEQFEHTIVGVGGALVQHMKEDGERGAYSAILSEEILAGIPNLLDIPLLEP